VTFIQKIVPITGTPAQLYEFKVGNKMVAKCFNLVQCKVILKLYWKFENVCGVKGSCAWICSRTSNKSYS